MQNTIENKLKSLVAIFVFMASSILMMGNAHAENILNKKISYFNGVLVLVVSGQTSSAAGVFTAEIKDASGKPYPAMNAEWISATVEMVGMDMGINKATVVNDGSAKVKIQSKFTMSGQWKLNIKLTTAAGSEAHSITLNVP